MSATIKPKSEEPKADEAVPNKTPKEPVEAVTSFVVAIPPLTLNLYVGEVVPIPTLPSLVRDITSDCVPK